MGVGLGRCTCLKVLELPQGQETRPQVHADSRPGVRNGFSSPPIPSHPTEWSEHIIQQLRPQGSPSASSGLRSALSNRLDVLSRQCACGIVLFVC